MMRAMLQYYDPRQAILIQSARIINSTSGEVTEASGCQFWDPVNASLCPLYLPWVSSVPVAIGLFIIFNHALLLVIPYRPIWLRPFVEEFGDQHKGLKLGRRRYLNFKAAAVLLLSICGLASQLMIVWSSTFHVQVLNLALAWAVAVSLVAILRPKIASKSLLILYISILLSEVVLLSQTRSTSTLDLINKIIQITLSMLASVIILLMPMRNPDLSNEEISPAFAMPSFDLRSPEDNITLWQFLSVSWMSPLISLGRQRQLNDGDVWKLGYEFQHKLLHENFRELKGSVMRRLVRANIIDLILLAFLGVADLIAGLAVPVLLQQILRSMENIRAPIGAAVTYAILSLVARLISGQVGVLSLWFGRRCYERSRGELITMLYEKTLNRKIVGGVETSFSKTNPAAAGREPVVEDDRQPRTVRESLDALINSFLDFLFRKQKTPENESPPKPNAQESASMGKILNLMRNDAYEICQRFWEFQLLVTKPLGLILSLALLWQIIGWPCLIGLLAVIVGQVTNAIFARALLRWERIRRTATDKKLQKVSQFVEAIRHLRWYGWQDKWGEQIMGARKRELNLRLVTGMWNILIGFTNALASGMFPAAAFYAYTALAGKSLRIDIAFPALQVFTMLETNLRELPGLITVLLNARVSVGRIEDYMGEPDKEQSEQATMSSRKGENHMVNHRSSVNAVVRTRNSQIVDEANQVANLASSKEHGGFELKQASFAWPGRMDIVLRDVSLSFSPGLTVICGQVGAGKSALLQSILGELDQIAGEHFRLNGMVGYCGQTPWLQSMSIRDNILFSAPYEEDRYQEVLEACALISDMANFKHGDRSFIGENGVGLSGGQRARLALARAIYSKADVLLLDDPISSLDHQTAEYIIERCLAGKLTAGRTVLLVTHRTELCHGFAKQIIEVSNGTVRVLDLEEPYADQSDAMSEAASTEQVADDEVNGKAALATPEKFMEEEHREHGGVRVAVYWEYIRAGKLKWWFILLCLLALLRITDIGQSWFLKQWGEAYNNSSSRVKPRGLFDSLPSPETNIRPWLIGFTLIATAKAVMFLISQCFMLVIVYITGRQMFRDVMTRVSHTTFRFYDVTPVGRLMNRLTSDLNTIDGNISVQFQNGALLSITWITSLVIIGSVTPVFLAFSLALTIAFVLVFLHFLPTSQSLRRLEMVSLTPLMSNFGSLLDGLMTVRAFCAQERFQARVITVVDDFQKMDHFYWSLQAWLMYRFDVLSAVSTLLLTLIAIYTGVSPALTAFVLIAAANFVASTHSLCRTYGQLQMDFVSVERVVELLHLKQELPGTVDPPAWWPTLSGDIIFENVTIRYAPHLSPSLADLSFHIKAGSSTAIIGRTGSGKSTLAMALLATILPDEGGRILVDNIDLAAVDKQALRERITFVAQDPVLFPGSMRQNLDPLVEYSDEECEAVLHKICGRHQWILTTQIEAGGRNLSQGQRQLIGLARTLLRRSPIVILDEATASIDMETAQSIQKVLHEEMKGRTVITIAHRLEAVKNAEYCIVLGKGRIIKQGRAEDILKDDSNALLAQLESNT